MSFLAPLFLVGAAAIIAPILYHLIRRTTRERMVFSSLMFLAPSPPRLSKRHRIEHVWLLLLRCLALALLAFAFARPFLRQALPADAGAEPPKRILVLVDTSASMRRDGVWAEARAKVDAVLRRVAPTDQVALFTFDRAAKVLLPFDEWNRAPAGDRVALANARLGGVAPGWSGTHLGNALVTAAEALAETEGKGGPGPRAIVLVSDLQAGSRLDALQAYEWPKGVQLFVEPVKARNVTNAGVQLVAEALDANRAAETAARVRVTNSSESKRERFKLGWARASAPGDFAGEALDVYVPPGQSRVFAVPLPKEGGTSRALDRIILRGDDEPFDNTVFVIPPTQGRVSVLWLGNDAPDDTKQPLFFLRRALTETPRVAVTVVARGASAPLAPADLAGADIIFVAEPLPAARASALREQALAGKLIVIVAKSAALAPTLGALVGRDEVALSEATPGNYAMFGEIDFQHPLFAPFADPRFSDFTKIHIWKYRKLDAAAIPAARVIAKFDRGDPAIVEVPAGKGKVFVLTTGWQPEDSQLAVSSKFVPLLWSLVELAGGAEATPVQYFIGDTITATDSAAKVLRTPAGATVRIDAAGGGVELTEPGIHELASDGAAAGVKPARRFAVNLDPNESRTAALGVDELEHLGVPVVARARAEAAAAENKRLLQAAEAENRQKLWRCLIATTLAVLLAESALAGWTARRASLETEEATP